MILRFVAVLGAAAVLVGGAAGVQADTSLRHASHRRDLPPVSGTLRMTPEDFGAPGRIHRPAHVYARRAVPRSGVVEVVRGGLFPSASYAYVGLTPAERWATGGTGLSGQIGNTGNPFAGEAAWGTADSATTGIAGPPRFAGQNRGLFTAAAERPLIDRYGEPPIYAGYAARGVVDVPAYGAAPQVPFYGSGAPYSMSYYSSGSSAGPYGSPGGLGVYRSGSYGYGSRIIRVGDRAGWRQGCTCGPRIVRLDRRHHRRYAGK